METNNDNKYKYETFERSELSKPALLVEDILMTLMREFGVITIKFEKFMDVCNSCLNFIYKMMPTELTVEYLEEYSSLPDVPNAYQIVQDLIFLMNDDSLSVVDRAKIFQDIRPLFASAIIDELQICDCIERAFVPNTSDESVKEEQSFYFIKNLTNKTTNGVYRYGIVSASKSDSYVDKSTGAVLKNVFVTEDCELLRCTIKYTKDLENVIEFKVETPLIGLLVTALIEKHFLKTDNYYNIIDVLLTQQEQLYK